MKKGCEDECLRNSRTVTFGSSTAASELPFDWKRICSKLMLQLVEAELSEQPFRALTALELFR